LKGSKTSEASASNLEVTLASVVGLVEYFKSYLFVRLAPMTMALTLSTCLWSSPTVELVSSPLTSLVHTCIKT
jgi:hypothetical protein